MINFQSIKLKDKEIFDRYLRSNRYEGSESTFTNFFMWKECYRIEWAIVDDFLCIKPNIDNVNFLLPPYPLTPLGDSDLTKPLEKLITYFAEKGYPFEMRGVSSEVKDILERLCPDKFTFTQQRETFDYVYLVEDLINLKGRKYHRKRNHLKNFKKQYPQYQYSIITKELIKPCLVNLYEWCRKKGCEDDKSLLCERDAIIAAFECYDQLDFIGGAILVDGNVEAFTFGEALNEDTVLIHAEKANPDIKGIFQAINQEYLIHHWSHMKYVNREEDMGIEGLRKAKESYYPVELMVKYQAVLKD